MKKVLSAVSALAILASFTACGKDNNESTSNETKTTTAKSGETTTAVSESGEKEVINLWTFTDEVPKMVEKFMAMNPDFAAKYEVKPTIIPTTDGNYQPALDKALQGGGKDAPDFYCAESAFVLKYTQGDMSSYAAPYKDLGIDVDAEISDSQIAPYSVEIGTNNGNVVGLGYQATGGAFIYRRSLAKDAFGTDDPDAVADKIGGGSGNWDKFFEAAETLKGKGYAIISGDGDLWHAVENSSEKGWIVDGKLHIDEKRENFLDLSKKLKDNDYHNDTQDWQEPWKADMRDEGTKKVFGFFGPAWLINYTLAENSGSFDEDGNLVDGQGTYGDWAVCKPPVGFFWGGTWLIANKDSSKKEAVGKIIEWITLDSSDTGLQYMWANGTLNGEGGTKDTVASNTVMAKSDGTLAFLGGQNMFDVFVPANEYANGKNLTQYDETINGWWRDQVRQYTSGSKSRDQAIADFKQQVSDNLAIDAE